jgi:preprotein translocase subunit SecG
MEILLIVVHVITCLILVLVILLQSGKGGGMGAGFGGAAAAGQQIFGGRGAATFLGKATVGLAAVFMATSLSLAYLSSKPRSALDLTSAPDISRSSQVDQIVDQGSAAPAPSAPVIDEPMIELPALDELPFGDEQPGQDLQLDDEAPTE